MNYSTAKSIIKIFKLTGQCQRNNNELKVFRKKKFVDSSCQKHNKNRHSNEENEKEQQG